MKGKRKPHHGDAHTPAKDTPKCKGCSRGYSTKLGAITKIKGDLWHWPCYQRKDQP